jgi:kojibiose phosphorylase
MREGEMLEHRRVLDLAQGMLLREWRQRDSHGRITRFNSLRLASLADRRLLLQQIVLTAENYCLDIRMESSYELGPGIRALFPEKKNVIESDRPATIPLAQVLPDGTVEVAFCITSQLITTATGHQERELKRQDDRIVESFQIQAGAGTSCQLNRFVSVIRRSDDSDVLAEALDHANAAWSSGVHSAVCAHHARWRSKWDSADVQVVGDDVLQQALRFAVYHLISAANPDDSRTSIGARALTGTAYRGHVFWDTEIYMLPFYTCTAPASARALLGYRYHTLPAARDKARNAGYRGAMYAWESADTGEEVTPTTAVTLSGEVIPIRNGAMEVHITADIAYAVWQYWKGTADDTFLLDYGAEILLESARFWASRGRIEQDGLYHIRHVIGPDEYHEDVDDNAFTNLMASWNLRRGVEVFELLRERWAERWQKLADKLQISDSEASDWPKLADVVATGFDPATLIYEQFAGYFEKEHVDLKTYEPRFAAMDAILGYNRVQQTDIVKQPDVVMAIYLLWDQFPLEVREANFRYYEPRTAHGSSLSPSIHALVAARLGDIELAAHYLRQSAEIDLGNTMGNAAGGVHAAALGGLWQAIMFGFAGVQLDHDGITLSPNLLVHWGRLSFPLQWRNCHLQITIEPQSVRVEAAGPDAIKIRLQDGEEFTANPQHSYVSVRGAEAWNQWRTDRDERSCV